MLKKLGLLVIVLTLMVAALPGVSAQDPVTFVFGSEGNPVQLDSAVVTDGISFRVISQGCEGLLGFKPGTTEPEAKLATAWSASEDGLTWTLTLREGVTFQDGSPFNAEAVVWNFNRWRMTDHPQHYPEQVFEYYEAQFGGFDDASIITNVEAASETEVVFTLSTPMGAFLNNLAMPMFTLHNPAAVEAAGNTYGTPDVGYNCTGPYSFVEWVNDDSVTLTKNEAYWGEIPGNVEQIVFRIIPDAAARLAALQAGDIDSFERPSVEDISVLEGSEDTYVIPRPAFNTFYVAFNYRVQEFQNPLVREAISLAIDRQAIVDAFYIEGAVTANTMNPPTIAIGFNGDIQTPYDPELAKQKLAEAGYPDGLNEVTILKVDDAGNITDEVEETKPLQLYFMPVSRPYNPDGQGIGEAMVSFLAEAGINAELASVGDWAAYLDARANGQLTGLYQLGWTGDNGDPDNFIGYFFANADAPLAREGFYQNAEVAALLQEARSLTDAAARDALYKEAEALMAAGAERVYIAHGPVPLAFRSNIEGYIPSPMGTEEFKFVTKN